jgi:hypothetical protein
MGRERAHGWAIDRGGCACNRGAHGRQLSFFLADAWLNVFTTPLSRRVFGEGRLRIVRGLFLLPDCNAIPVQGTHVTERQMRGVGLWVISGFGLGGISEPMGGARVRLREIWKADPGRAEGARKSNAGVVAGRSSTCARARVCRWGAGVGMYS